MLQMPIEPLPDASLRDALRDRLARDWNHLKDKVRATFGRLTDDDVTAVSGRYDELSRRLSGTYGYDAARTDEEISRFVSEGGASAVVSTPPEDTQALDHRGMGAGVGRNDVPVSPAPMRLSEPHAPPPRSR
jgi:uncharacterized protein YjbJ (UPF0337 family)